MEIFGEQYYIDLNEFIKSCESEFKVVEKNNEIEEIKDIKEPVYESQIDLFKYEIAKMCVQRVLSDEFIPEDSDYQDETLASITSKDENKPVSYKIAFNTLLNNGIIKIGNNE